MGWAARRDLYTSIAASGVTSETYNVEGMRNMTLQVVGANSITTIRGSNDDGRSAAITNWSTLTCVIGEAMVEIDPGFRWIQLQRSATTNAILAGWQRSS